MCTTAMLQLYGSAIPLGSLLPLLHPSLYGILFALSGLKYLHSQALSLFPLSNTALRKVRTIHSHQSVNNHMTKNAAHCRKGEIGTLWFSGIRKNGSLRLHLGGKLFSHILTQEGELQNPPPKTSPRRASYLHWTCVSSPPSPVTLCSVWFICTLTSSWTSWGQTPCFIHLLPRPWHDARLMLPNWPTCGRGCRVAFTLIIVGNRLHKAELN